VLHRPAVPAVEVTESEAREARRRRRKVLRRRVRRRGRRLGTISYRCNGGENRPLLRLSGKWLARVGFPIGQEFEVVVEEGRLVLEAV
jgi:Toxin SymE, type I toxin-antitoxin system